VEPYGSYLCEEHHYKSGITMGIGWLIGLLILFIAFSVLVLVVKISLKLIKIAIGLGLIVLIVIVLSRLLGFSIM
jgi:amino acid transporter